MAHRSLGSIIRCCRHAELLGITTQVFAVLDDADEETQRVIHEHPALRQQDQTFDLSFGDVALSRNYAIRESKSKYVAIIDGDDHVSTNWLGAAFLRATKAGGASIVHPQTIISFGATSIVRYQPDQIIEKIDKARLLVSNLWNICAFGRREIFIDVPYISTGKKDSGFGFEDWHWNCETVASGYLHVTALRTVYFERHKSSGSLNRVHQQAGAVIRSSRLFRQL